MLAQLPGLLRSLSLDASLIVPISMAWLLFGLSWGFFGLLGHRRRWHRHQTGALVLTAGLGNTAFVGFPLLAALIGPEAVRLGILVDQPGTFLVVSTLGLVAAAEFSGSRVTARVLARRVFSFPPLIAMLAAFLWFALGTPGAELALPAFEKIAATLVPLALFSVGFQLHVSREVLRRRAAPLALGLGFKLLLAPAIFAVIYLCGFGQRGLGAHVTVLEAAMAPMITSAIVASEFNLDPELANLMVGVGIPLSLVTVPIWHWLLP